MAFARLPSFPPAHPARESTATRQDNPAEYRRAAFFATFPCRVGQSRVTSLPDQSPSVTSFPISAPSVTPAGGETWANFILGNTPPAPYSRADTPGSLPDCPA